MTTPFNVNWDDEMRQLQQADLMLFLSMLQVEGDYSHKVSLTQKRKTLRKWGRNPDVDTVGPELVWRAGDIEVLPPSGTNPINRVASTDAADTGDVLIEGHVDDGSGNLTFSTQTVTLNGLTPVALSPSLARANRLVNRSGVSFAGDISVYESGNSEVHTFADGLVAVEPNQSEKCATSISQVDYWFITSFWADVRRATSAVVDLYLQVREKDGVFRTQLERTVSTTGSNATQQITTPIIIRPNSDVRVLCQTTANNTAVYAAMAGPLGIIVS